MVCKVPSSEHEAYRIAPGMDIAAAFKEQLLYPKDWYGCGGRERSLSILEYSVLLNVLVLCAWGGRVIIVFSVLLPSTGSEKQKYTEK